MDILSYKLVKSRKPHKCVGCSRIFAPGSQIYRVASADGGTAYTDYLCPTCSTLLYKNDITEYSEGDLFEDAVAYEKELSNKQRRDNISKRQIYKHFKGELYIVEDFACYVNNGKTVVVYRALYGNNTLYVRDIDDFLSEVDREKYPDAEQTYRFELFLG